MRKALQFIIRPYIGFSKNTWKLLATGFMNASCLTLTIYLTLYFNALHFSLGKVGWMITLFSIGGLIGGYLGGWLTDKYSALTICKLSLITSSIAIFLIVLNKNFYYLSALTIITGTFTSLFRPAFILALTDEGKSSSLEKVIALRRVAINLGMASGVAVFGFVAAISYNFLFCIMGAMNLFAFIILKNIKDAGKISSEKAVSNDSIRNNGFFILLSLMFLISLIFNQTQITYPLFLKNNLGLAVSFISILFTLNGILIACFQMPITTIFSKLNTNLTCALGAFLLSIGLAILPLCSSKNALIVSCSIWTLGEIIFYPAILALIIKMSGNKKGKSMGLYQLFFSFASFIAPVIGTLAYSFNHNLVWYMSGMLGLIITFYFLLSIKKTDTAFAKVLPLKNEALK